jgi:hypothetical protein
MKRVGAALVLLLAMIAARGLGDAMAAPATSIAPLDAARVPALLDAARGPRVIALWSLECTYCEENLRALLQLHAAHPAIDLVLVSTDPIARGNEIGKRLAALGASALPSYAYDDAMPQRLGLLLDPGWGGELPRTLVLAGSRRRAWSGALHPADLGAIVDFAAAAPGTDRRGNACPHCD